MLLKLGIKFLTYQASIRSKKGQVIVEYIFLLLISVVISLLLIKLVTLDPKQGSPLFNYWRHVLQVIGQDIST